MKGKHLLRIACENDSIDVVKLLINKGIDPCYNESVLFRDSCKLHGKSRVTKYLCLNFEHSRFAYMHSFFFACKNGHLDLIKMIMSRSIIDVNASNGLAIVTASKNGYLDIIKFLIEKGAFVYCRNNDPLKYACENGHFEVAKLLIENGAKMNKYNKESINRSIEKYGRFDILEMLNTK